MTLASDLPVILQWWGAWLAITAVGWPMAGKLFGEWEDGGYIWGKITGLGIISWLMLAAGSLSLVSFSWTGIAITAAAAGGTGWLMARRKISREQLKKAVIYEAIFLAALVFWSWIKAHEPSINGLEKFMDYGFTRSIMRSETFPPGDMWFAGESINYYYFGHLMLATVTKFSGLDPAYTFNLMLATIFALGFTSSWAIGRQMLKRMPERWRTGGALLTAFLVTLAGNLQTIYAFTKGYAGSEDNPPPFWKILVNPLDKQKLITGWNSYWYPNATRFIPYTIHEFPSYSFVVSDVHGHVLSIPLALLALAMLVNMYGREREKISWHEYGAYGAVAGASFMTNALDGLVYLGLLALLTITQKLKDKKPKFKITSQDLRILLVQAGAAGAVFVVAVWPFVSHFKPFVSGVAVNCPPEILAYKPAAGETEGMRKIGPLVFEGVEKCQKSPLWMLLILWGFFLYCGIGLWKMQGNGERKMLMVWAVYSAGLILFAEFFYFKDIYPQHFRSNTMFKLGYQVFMMMAIMSGYVLTRAVREKRKLWLLGAAPLLFLVSIYPYFGVKSYFGELKVYRGIYGLAWMGLSHPDDWAAIDWLNKNIGELERPVVLEANGDSYTDYDRISAFTGLPTVAGWTVHEWLWRGSYGPIAGRAEEVRQIYEAPAAEAARPILDKYKVEYIVVGTMERQKYPQLNETVIATLGQPAFSHGTITIYKIN